jgi:hypothetical protein
MDTRKRPRSTSEDESTKNKNGHSHCRTHLEEEKRTELVNGQTIGRNHKRRKIIYCNPKTRLLVAEVPGPSKSSTTQIVIPHTKVVYYEISHEENGDLQCIHIATTNDESIVFWTRYKRENVPLLKKHLDLFIQGKKDKPWILKSYAWRRERLFEYNPQHNTQRTELNAFI